MKGVTQTENESHKDKANRTKRKLSPTNTKLTCGNRKPIAKNRQMNKNKHSSHK